MRIDRLDLSRYGRFTDATLDLSGAGIHLVFGPNEAGKSTIRNAVGDLLYGIPLRTDYAFLHEMSQLRLGALLRGADGIGHEIVRLKRNKDPLRTPGDEPFAQEVLDGVIAGVSRTEFTDVFAIDHEELRRGGRRLLDVKGEVGRALFESRSSARLTSLLSELRAEYERIYLHRGQKPTLNLALSDAGPYRSAVRERDRVLLKPQDYEAAKRDLDEAGKRRDRIAEDLRRAREEHARLERIRHSFAGMAERKDLLGRRRELLASGPSADPEAGEAYERLRDERREHEAELARVTQSIERIEVALGGLDPDRRLLAQAREIEELYAEASSVAKAGKQAAAADKAARQLRADAERELASVQTDAGLREAGPVTTALRARVEELTKRHIEVEAGLREARKRLRKRQEGLEDAAAEPGEEETVADPAPLRAAVKAVPATLVERLEQGRARLATARDRLAKAHKRYARFELPEDCADRTLPGEEEITAWRSRWEAAEKLVGKLQERHEALREDLARDREALDRFLEQDPPPGEEELRELRERRRALWAGLRPRLSAGAQPALEAELPVDEYENAVEASDHTVDRMRKEAQRVAERASLESAVRLAAKRLADNEPELAQGLAVRDELEQEWTRLWSPSGLAVPTPESAKDLLAAVGTLRQLSDEADALAAASAADTETAAAHCRRLREVLTAAGVDVAAELARATAEPGEAAAAEATATAAEAAVTAPAVVTTAAMSTAALSLSAMLETARGHIDVLVERAEEQQEAAALGRRQRDEAREAAHEVEEREAALEEWAAEWAALLERHGLSGRPDEVSATLTALDAAAQLHRQAGEQERIAAEARDQAEACERSLAAVLAACGREPIADPSRTQATITALKSALDAAADDQRDHERLSKELTEARSEHARLASALEEDEARLAALVERVGVRTEQELREAVRRAAGLAELDAALGVVEKSLGSVGVSLERLEREIEDEGDPDRLRASIADLAARITQGEEEQAEAVEQFTRAAARFDRMNGSADAAVAADAVERELSAIADHAQDYLRLRLAEQILLQSIETYRAQNQAPVLHRAQRLFAGLTLDEYTQLAADTDEKGEIVLQAVHRGSKRVGVTQMSEGTLDQLYLALRLASLEHYADEGRSMPLVLDDVLMTFDDERTSAGLRLFDELAERFQVIVLTHHRHLAELAGRALGPGRLHVHDLVRSRVDLPTA